MWSIEKKKNYKWKARSVKRIANRENLFADPHTLSAEKGFTLIELLVATSILGIIGLTILTTFASGFHVFERVQAFGGAQADVFLAFEEMEKDLKNLFPLSSIAFEGDAQSVAFPAVIETSELIDGEESVVSSVGKVSYFTDQATYFNDAEKGLTRAAQGYAQAIAETEAQDDQKITLAPVESLLFEYYTYNEETKEYGWQGSWSGKDENLLSGVKIAITYKDGDRDVEAERTVWIPAVQKIFEIKQEEEDEEGEDDVD
jgi:prepilin-type N-terminal cleavage/methylation domain-containing protein